MTTALELVGKRFRSLGGPDRCYEQESMNSLANSSASSSSVFTSTVVVDGRQSVRNLISAESRQAQDAPVFSPPSVHRNWQTIFLCE